MSVILVRGTGDVGSAVAHVLYLAGHRVVLHDAPAPSHSRRGMAFVNALYEGKAELAGVLAKRAKNLSALRRMLRCGRAVPVVDGPLERVIAEVRPQVLVDARMRKHDQPESQRGLAPLTIGLGPQFEAGSTADVAVETAWGDDLGKVLWSGRTRDLEGEPQEIHGHARDRYLYAPCAGVFSTRLNIGDSVVKDQEIARIGAVSLHAPLSGRLRGLSHDGAPVIAGAKVIEVDPRGEAGLVSGLGQRPSRIAEGVLQAVREARTNTLGGDLKPLSVSALIGALGGLIGLGGAEFRLPALVGLFKFDVRQAIVLNVVISLVTVAASLGFRLSLYGVTPVASHVEAIVSLVCGSVIGAYIGSGLVRRLETHSLHRAVGLMLVGLAVVMASHGLLSQQAVLASDPGSGLLAAAGLIGIGIGIVGSTLGVAGGELLIPTLVLLFGVDVMTAGTLSLSISVPMLLVTLWRLSVLPSTRDALRHRRFVGVMAVGSLLGAYAGSRLAGIAPDQLLSLILALILLASALKTFSK